MPIYSYACKSCSHAFDIQQAFTDDSLTSCPECAGGLRKVYGAVGVVFKGSGFYRTDSVSAASRSGSESGSSSGSSTDASTSSSSTSSKEVASSTSSSGTSSSSTAPD